MNRERLTSRVLVLGGTGMLGHRMVQTLSPQFDTWATCRKPFSELAKHGIFSPDRMISGIDAMQLDEIDRVIAEIKPDAVVNCIGIVKQHALAKDAVACLTINSLLPHRAAKACEKIGARFIHVSTDCVFDGKRGNYSESDEPTADDLYGRSKWMGEVSEGNALTLRTSIIGPELEGSSGLLDWFLSGHEEVKGYTHAFFSGLTTHELSRVIAKAIAEYTELTGLYQVAGPAICKHDLLCLIRDAFGLSTVIVPDGSVRIDRTLNGRRFAEATGYCAPTWSEMIGEIASEQKSQDETEAYVLAG